MKFFCDNCQAQYMISDEKVGPAGVRVRCKKCSHVIYVKRLDAEPPPEDATVVMTAEKMAALSSMANQSPATSPGSEAGESAPAAEKPLGGLEEEIGQALDSMFADGDGDSPAAPVSPTPSSRAPIVLGSPRSQAPVVPDPGALGSQVSADDDRAETRIFTSLDMAKIAAEVPAAASGESGSATASDTAGSAASGTDWFIAIRDEQVGPLQLDQIKEKFEAGEVAGDTLVWSAGLTDWRPLSTVEELAEHILPKRDITRTSRGPAPAAELAKEPARKEAVSFKPSAASALASLASMAKEEMAASEKAKPAAKAVALGRPLPEGRAASEARSDELLPGLPSPSPDLPTAMPPQVSGQERASAYSNGHARPRASQAPADFNESPLARSRPRSPEGQNWKLIGGIIAGAVVLLVALGAGAYFAVIKPNQEMNTRLEQERKEDAAKAQAAAAAAQAAAQAAAAAAQAKAVPPPTTPAPPPAVPVGEALPAAKVAESTHEHERHGGKHKGKETSAEAASSPSAPAPTPAAEREKPAGKSDDFLGGTDVDKEFANELDGKGGAENKASRHGPYIPPPPGQSDLPQSLSQSDIVGAVTQHRDAFAKCVQDQKRRDPGSSGTVVIRWKIKPDGRSTDVGASGDDPDSPLASCFKGQIRSLHFGQYRGPQMAPIQFPFSY